MNTEINQDTPQTQILTVDMDERLYGVGSKLYRIYAASAISRVIEVESNFNNLDESAVIENLIIDGQNYSGIEGIHLENVYNCFIRNLTIKNCDVGIHLRLTDGKWTEFTRIEHVRMENVKKGILFTTEGPLPENPSEYPGDSAGFTKIDDVGIALKDDADAVGIQIGDGTFIKPYSSYIKANIWMQSAGGTGMKLDNAELQFGLISLAVSGPSNGYGIKGTNAVIAQNQQFLKSNWLSLSKGVFLTCAGITHYVDGVGTGDIDIKTW